MDLINLLLNLKIYAKIRTKLFFLEFFVFKKNAKSCYVFFFNAIWFLFEKLGHMQLKYLNVFVWKKNFIICFFVWKETGLFNTRKKPRMKVTIPNSQ
jgi:hypothetical protein